MSVENCLLESDRTRSLNNVTAESEFLKEFYSIGPVSVWEKRNKLAH